MNFLRDLRTILIPHRVEGIWMHASSPREALTRIKVSYAANFMYPWHDGVPRHKDPTYGKVDRDIQWFVNDIIRPETLAMRVVHEKALQRDRDAKKTTTRDRLRPV